MSKEQKTKERNIFGKVCSILTNILVVPVIILALICTITAFSAKANNEVPSIFGMSVVTVLTSSMEPDHMPGDIMIIRKVDDLDTLKVGDRIAFYAPLTSGYVDEVNGKLVSRVIYHQIVRIIYVATDTNNDGVNDTDVRYFCCRGINVFDPTYIQVAPGNGDYIKNEDGEFVVAENGNGNYDIELEDLRNPDDPTTKDIDESKMATMQYITDEYVVGVYDATFSPVLGGMIKFCGTSLGMLVLVIIPAALLIIIVLLGIIKEMKKAKEEEKEEQDELEANMTKLKETSAKNKEKVVIESNKEEQQTSKEEKIDIQSVIGSVVNESAKNEIKEDAKATKTKTTTKVPKVSKGNGVAEQDSNKQEKLVLPKNKKTVPIKKDGSDEVSQSVLKKAPPKKTAESNVSKKTATQIKDVEKKETAPKNVGGKKTVLPKSEKTEGKQAEKKIPPKKV